MLVFPLREFCQAARATAVLNLAMKLGLGFGALSDVAQNEKICGAQESVAHVAARADGDEIGGFARDAPLFDEKICNLAVGRRFDLNRCEACIKAIRECAHITVAGGDRCGLRREIVEIGEQQILRNGRSEIDFLDPFDFPTTKKGTVSAIVLPLATQSLTRSDFDATVYRRNSACCYQTSSL